jgi:hypothetical protein
LSNSLNLSRRQDSGSILVQLIKTAFKQEEHHVFKRNRRFLAVGWLTSAAICVPWQAVSAQQPKSSTGVDATPFEQYDRARANTSDAHISTGAQSADSEISDVALQPGGRLTGQVYDSSGSPAANVEVALLHYVNWPQMTVSDAEGRFSFENLSGGSYQIVADGKGSTIRAWAPNTAPPSARPDVLVVLGDQVVRGDWMDPGRGLVEWCRAHPWLVTIGAATAIAVPLALAAEDDDNS